MRNKQLALVGLIVASGFAMLECAQAGGTVQTFTAMPVISDGQFGPCPGSYAGYVAFVGTNTWGWAPDTNNTTIFTAADGGGRTDTCIMYNGQMLDKGCSQTSVTVPSPPPSGQYRFTIYFPTNPPTTNYPIILTGFQ